MNHSKSNDKAIAQILTSAKLIKAEEKNVSPVFKQALREKLYKIILTKQKEESIMDKLLRNASMFNILRLGLFTAIGLTILGIGATLVAIVKPEIFFGPPHSTLVTAEGKVQYKAEGKDWQDLTNKVAILEGYSVKTDTDSKANLTLPDA